MTCLNTVRTQPDGVCGAITAARLRVNDAAHMKRYISKSFRICMQPDRKHKGQQHGAVDNNCSLTQKHVVTYTKYCSAFAFDNSADAILQISNAL